MDEPIIVWVVSPFETSPGRRSIPGIFLQTEDGHRPLTAEEVNVVNVAAGFVQVSSKSDWLVVGEKPAWVVNLNSVDVPCFAAVVEPGGYTASAAIRNNSPLFVLRERRYYLSSAPLVVFLLKSRARGYRRGERADRVSPFISPGVQPNEDDVRRYFESRWGRVIERVVARGGGVFDITWRSPYGRITTTIAIERAGTWRTVSLGVCVNGADRLVPTESVPEIVEHLQKEGRVEGKTFW